MNPLGRAIPIYDGALMKPSRPVMLGSIVLLAVFVLFGELCAEKLPPLQDKAPDKVVILNVRVTDALSKAVVDVPQSSFQITEDGVPQSIAFFSKEEIPLSYGLVIDTSGSLRSQLPKVLQAGGRIVNSNKQGDETFLVRFISSDKVETVQDTTSDKGLLIAGLSSLYVEGGLTAVLDAVYLSAEKLAKQRSAAGSLRRRALVLVTDGEDRHSDYKVEQLFSLLGSTDIQIYAIGFTGELRGKARERAANLLARLATDTGGRAFFPTSTGELEHIADQIINDIRTQYVIGYVPTYRTSSNTFHKVQVSLAENANQEKRIAVTRIGYSGVGK
jgi:Ca-activated chloride channel homolog